MPHQARSSNLWWWQNSWWRLKRAIRLSMTFGWRQALTAPSTSSRTLNLSRRNLVKMLFSHLTTCSGSALGAIRDILSPTATVVVNIAPWSHLTSLSKVRKSCLRTWDKSVCINISTKKAPLQSGSIIFNECTKHATLWLTRTAHRMLMSI